MVRKAFQSLFSREDVAISERLNDLYSSEINADDFQFKQDQLLAIQNEHWRQEEALATRMAQDLITAAGMQNASRISDEAGFFYDEGNADGAALPEDVSFGGEYTKPTLVGVVPVLTSNYHAQPFEMPIPPPDESEWNNSMDVGDLAGEPSELDIAYAKFIADTYACCASRPEAMRMFNTASARTQRLVEQKTGLRFCSA